MSSIKNIYWLFRAMSKSSAANFISQGKKKAKASTGKTIVRTIFLILVIAAYGIGIFGQMGVMIGTVYASGIMPMEIAFGNILAIPLFIIILTSLPLIMNTMYIAKDIECYLVMPVKGYEIVLARMLLMYVYDFYMLAIFLLPSSLAFGYTTGQGVGFYLLVLVATFGLSIIPQTLMIALITIIMSIFKFIKNRERLNLFVNVFTLIGAILLGVSMAVQNNSTLASRGGGLGNIIYQLPLVNLPIKAIANLETRNDLVFGFTDSKYSVIYGLAYIAINIIFVVAVAWLANKLYIKSVIGISEVKAKRKVLGINQKRSYLNQTKSQLKIFILRDHRTICRSATMATQTYMNFIIVPIVLIVSIGAGIMSGTASSGFGEFIISTRSMVTSLIDTIPFEVILVFILSGALVITTLLASTTNLALFAISREGKQAPQLLAWPVSFAKIILAKFLYAQIVSCLVLAVMFVIPYVLFVGTKWHLLIITLVAAFVVSIIINGFDLILDLCMAKLDWEAENELFRISVKYMFSMVLEVAIAFGFAYSIYKVVVNLDSLNMSLVALGYGLCILVMLIAVGIGVHFAIPYCQKKISEV